MASCGWVGFFRPVFESQTKFVFGLKPLPKISCRRISLHHRIRITAVSTPALVSAATVEKEYGFLNDLLNFSSEKNKLKS